MSKFFKPTKGASQNRLAIELRDDSRHELRWNEISKIGRPRPNIIQIFCTRLVVLIEGGHLDSLYAALRDRSIETVMEGFPVPKYPARPFIRFIAVLAPDEYAAQQRLMVDASERA